MRTEGTIDAKRVEKSGHHASPQGVVAVAVDLGLVPQKRQNLGLTRARVRRADFGNDSQVDHLWPQDGSRQG